MIATSITGASVGGANQLFDLLAVVADPKGYAEKTQALMTLIEQQRVLVEAVGPASEVVALRDAARVDREAAAAAVQTAQGEADAIVADAKQKAAKSSRDARVKAEAIIAEAMNTQAQATAVMADAQKVKANAERSQREADSLVQRLAIDMEAAMASKAAADATMAEAEALRASLVEKHKAFIEGL